MLARKERQMYAIVLQYTQYTDSIIYTLLFYRVRYYVNRKGVNDVDSHLIDNAKMSALDKYLLQSQDMMTVMGKVVSHFFNY